MKEQISNEIQEWFDTHPKKEVTGIALPDGYDNVMAIYDIKNANIPIFGDYAIVFNNEEMEIWVANDTEHLEQQLRNQRLNC